MILFDLEETTKSENIVIEVEEEGIDNVKHKI